MASSAAGAAAAAPPSSLRLLRSHFVATAMLVQASRGKGFDATCAALVAHVYPPPERFVSAGQKLQLFAPSTQVLRSLRRLWIAQGWEADVQPFMSAPGADEEAQVRSLVNTITNHEHSRRACDVFGVHQARRVLVLSRQLFE